MQAYAEASMVCILGGCCHMMLSSVPQFGLVLYLHPNIGPQSIKVSYYYSIQQLLSAAPLFSQHFVQGSLGLLLFLSLSGVPQLQLHKVEGK